ncbi:MAG: molybdopterin-dependent oxidoreductase, partial [Planctomycetota bacterium]
MEQAATSPPAFGRRALRSAGLGALLVLAAVPFAYALAVMLAAGPRMAPLHLTGADPSERIADARAYRLRIRGKVRSELSLSLHEIAALPAVELDEPLACVVGWTDRATWRGPRIRDVLALAGIEPAGRFAVFHDDRDFSASL